MTKEYNTPMLQIISIRLNDIVTGSELMSIGSNYTGEHSILAPDHFRDDEGY